MTDKSTEKSLSTRYDLRPRRASTGSQLTAKRQSEVDVNSSVKRKKVNKSDDENCSPNLTTKVRVSTRLSVQRKTLAANETKALVLEKKKPLKTKSPKTSAKKIPMRKQKVKGKTSKKEKPIAEPFRFCDEERQKKIDDCIRSFRIDETLKSLGVVEDRNHGNCARAAIFNGFIKFSGEESDLDQVIFSGVPDDSCGHNFNATLRQLLCQPDNGGMHYEDGLLDATVLCDKNIDENNKEDCELGRIFVTEICSGVPAFDCGKFHNHCTDCKGCLCDYRDMHCPICKQHFFAMCLGSDYACPRCRDALAACRGGKNRVYWM